MEKIVVSWRDIPSQVIVKNGRKRAKVLLSHRFQQAVDRAAMRARKHSEDAYMSEWYATGAAWNPASQARPACRAWPMQSRRNSNATIPTSGLLALIRNHGLTERHTSPGTEQ